MNAPMSLGAIFGSKAKWVTRDASGEVSATFSNDDEGKAAAESLAVTIGGSSAWEMGR